MAKIKAKKKSTRGRKPKAFAEIVRMITRDSLLTESELRGEKTENELDEKGRIVMDSLSLPPGSTAVDTLNGAFVYSDERLLRHTRVMEAILREFSDDFFDGEEGASISGLRTDKKGRVWADDQTILYLCYTAVAMNLAIWPHLRREWAALPQGLPFIKFTCDKKENVVQKEQHE